MANLGSLEAQDIIRQGNFDNTNYEHVYDLYACAYDEEKAQAAKSAALERFVKQECNRAYKN